MLSYLQDRPSPDTYAALPTHLTFDPARSSLEAKRQFSLWGHSVLAVPARANCDVDTCSSKNGTEIKLSLQ